MAGSETMEAVLDRLIREAETATPVPAASDIPPTEAVGNRTEAPSGEAPLNSLLNGLAANPALLSAIPQLLKGFGGLAAGGGEGKPSAAESPVIDRHTALLCALKPYLGSSRQQAAEYLINLCRVWGTLQGMGLNLPALIMPAQASGNTHETGGDENV